MGLFRDKDKEGLQEALNGLLANIGANNGNPTSPPILESRERAEQLVRRMVEKGRAEEVRAMLASMAEEQPQRFFYGRTPTDAMAAMEASTGAGQTTEPDQRAVACWREALEEMVAILGSP